MISCISHKRINLWLIFIYSLFIAAIALFFCSRSSFGYPINDWSDANIYFSIGKGMLRGDLVYRDLYDHKGPLLYALHALCALVSPMNFTGVYGLEVLCAAAFLTCVYQLLALYGLHRVALLALPVVALLTYSSFSFQAGDSAEEICLPLLAFSLYDLLRHLKKEYPKRMSARRLIANGAIFGCVFWVKFTLIGLHAGFFLALYLSQATQKQWKQAFACVGWFALGFVLSTVPWVIYFGLNGALLPWLKTYLYDNLFLYSSTEDAVELSGRVKEMGKSGFSWLLINLRYTLLIIVGLGWRLFGKKHEKQAAEQSDLQLAAVRWERASLLMMTCLLALSVFIGGKSYPYYGLALAVLAPLGLIPIGRWTEKQICDRVQKRGVQIALGSLLCVTCLALCPVLSGNVAQSFGQPRESTMQYQFAEILSHYDSPTLLNYGFMDAGFFTASGIVPSVKYFHQTNVPLQEMLDEQIRYIDEGICDFIVTRGKEPASIHNQYELIATADSPKGFWYEKVYLYRRAGVKEW